MTKPDRTLVYRITHVDNVPWILDNGLHANSCETRDPNFRQIGNADLIGKRRTREVPVQPGGTLDDYVPFYYGTHSVMLYNIHTGRVPGVNVAQGEIVYLVSAVDRVDELCLPFLITDRHAYPVNTNFSAEPGSLAQLDWDLIRGRDFSRDPDRPDKSERRMAEFLVHRYLPVEALLGIACYDDAVCMKLNGELEQRKLKLYVAAKRDWYF